MKIAMVSEHASPLATLGGVDAGGQNVHVAALATALVERGHEVVVYTRRDSPALPRRVTMRPGLHVEHVTAGPAVPIAKDSLLPHMAAFAEGLARTWEAAPAGCGARPLLDERPGLHPGGRPVRRTGRADVPRPRRRQASLAGRPGHQPGEPARARTVRSRAGPIG